MSETPAEPAAPETPAEPAAPAAPAEPPKASGDLNTPPPAPAADPKAPEWLPTADADTTAYIAQKGWDKAENPTEAIFKSYQNLEKLFGAKEAKATVEIPHEGTTPEDLDAFYNKLGRPEKAEDYSYPEMQHTPDEMIASAPAKFHELGLTDAQATGLIEWYNEGAGAYAASQEEGLTVESGQQQAALQKEWGAAYDQNIQVAKEAAGKLGWDEATIDGLQSVLGYDGVMKMAHAIGTKTGEGAFIQGQGGRGGEREGIMSPSQAKSELDKLGLDDNFMKAWTDKNHPGHKAAVDKKAQLSRWAAGQA